MRTRIAHQDTTEKRTSETRTPLTERESHLHQLVKDGVHKRMARTSKNLLS